MSQKQIEVQSLIDDSTNKSGVYYNFIVEQHVETKKEKDSFSIYKAEFNFVYNREAKIYESYIDANNNLSELNLINFYDVLDNNVNSKKNDLTQYFEKDLDLKFRNISNKIKLFSTGLKEYQTLEDFLPFYTQIIYDNVLYRKSKIFSLFREYNIQRDILKFFSSEFSQNSKYVEISNGILLDNDIINDYSFFNKFQEILDSNTITYDDAKAKKDTYFEVIGYKISKYYGSKGYDNNPIQEWYIPNVSSKDTQLIDSQIKYSKKYFYKISLILATVGIKYTSSLVTDTSVFLTEVDSTGYEGFLLESPPVQPDIFFVPYMGEANRIKVLLNGIIDKYEAKPVKILASDVDFIKTLQNSDLVSGDKIIYESKDSIKQFQVMRLDAPPVTYEDFAFGKIINIPKGLTTLEDDIESNKKYYYIARCIDFHGQISNPTEVFTVELVNDLGTIYPIFGTYTFQKQEELKQLSKKFSKTLLLEPRLTHLIYDEERNKDLEGLTDKDAILQNVKIGTVTPDIWDKKFKLRVTSLSTGKKIDLNLQFKKQRLQKK
jgi:hypothetical protein